MTAQVIHGECLEVLRDMADSSVDSIVTDPPYGLSFMGKRWDYDVPSSDIWAECLRVLKPGGYLLAFAGTRTQHRMAVRIEDAGFEIRDMIAWVYGCLDEQTEVATSDGVKPYHKTKVGDTVLCYNPDNGEYSYQPILEIVEYEYSDTAYRLVGDFGEQVVSRNHRCIVEQDGAEVFVLAEQAARQQQVRVPVLESLPELRQAVSDAQQDASEAQQDLRHGVPAGCGAGNWSPTDALGVRPPRQSRRDGQPTGELDAVQYERTAQGIRAWSGHRTAMVRVVPFHYTGKVWCLRVPTGAFVAVRNGVAFPTGNSGFPKSANVSKKIDKQEQNKWLNVCKAIDNMSQIDTIELWKDYSSRVKSAALTFGKSQTGTGTSTPKGGSVPDLVRLEVSPERSHASAIIAELSSSEARRTTGASSPSVPSSAEGSTTVLSVLASSVERSPASPEVMPGTMDSSAPCDASDSHGASTESLTRAEEALMIWLGRKPSSRQAATDALCAALTDDLKHTILSRSRTFQSLDTISQTDFVSATTATITESTAASLISSTVDTLRNKAIDKAAGAEREVVGSRRLTGTARIKGQAAFGATSGRSEEAYKDGSEINDTLLLTAPATDDARKWQGWGTALKPALETVTVARKPLAGTVAENVLEHDTGAINVDGCRVGTVGGGTHCNNRDENGKCRGHANAGRSTSGETFHGPESEGGRWPANLIHSGEDDAIAGLGEAARYFYCAKASKADRGSGNTHPTVKPTDLMRYLCRLVTPPGGVVLDPFMGSGSTGKAAGLEGFSFVGSEREQSYLEIAEKRIKAVYDLESGSESTKDDNVAD